MALAKKKSSAKNATTTASSAIHPPYFQMIGEAITFLNDRTGSSHPAIAKFLEEKYSTVLPPNFKKMLSVQLKKFVKSEKLIKVKNSYKVSAAEKANRAAYSAKDSHKKKDVKKVTVRTAGQKGNTAAVEKAARTKRLCQVRTPEALKKKTKVLTNVKGSVNEKRMKHLSEVKTPEGLKRKKAAATPPKMKVAATKSSKSTSPTAKKAKK